MGRPRTTPVLPVHLTRTKRRRRRHPRQGRSCRRRREHLAQRRHMARIPFVRSSFTCHRDPRCRWRHTLGRHRRGVRLASLRHQGPDQSPRSRTRLDHLVRVRDATGSDREAPAELPTDAPSRRASDPGNRSARTFCQCRIHTTHSGCSRARIKRTPTPVVPSPDAPRVTGSVAVEAEYHRFLGQPDVPALRVERLLPSAPSDGTHFDHRKQAHRDLAVTRQGTATAHSIATSRERIVATSACHCILGLHSLRDHPSFAH